MAAIQTDGLTKRFGSVTAVDDLDLTVEDGEVYGFLGPNGAGKSTTIDALLGFTRPTEGSVRVLGTDVTERPRRVRERVGLLPEGYEFYPNLAGRRAVRSAIEAKDADDDPDELLARVGLAAEDAARAVGGYSKGMAQRLALAVALVGEPELLVLDEPSSGLDPNGVTLLREVVREEAARGATVFFSSHVLGEVERVCDRVGIMQAGRLVTVDEVAALRDTLDLGARVRARLTDPAGEPSLDGVAGASLVAVEDDTVVAACREPAAKMRVLRHLDDAHGVADVRTEEAGLEAAFAEVTAGETATPEESAAAEGSATPEETAAAEGSATPEETAAAGGGPR